MNISKKTTASLLGFAIVSMSLITSCSKSDDNDEASLNIVESPLIKAGITIPVKSIEEECSDEGFNSRITFNYSDNYLISTSSIRSGIDFDKTEIKCYFDYKPLKISYITNGDNVTLSDFSLNKDGYVTYCTLTSYDEKCAIKCSYNSDGYIIQMSEIDLENSESYEKNNTYIVDYSWKDGNLVRINNKIDDMVFNYDNAETNSGIYLTEFDFYECGSVLSVLYYTGLFGKPTKHIPNSMTYNNSETINLVCTKNTKGQIIKIVYDTNSGFRHIRNYLY